MSSFEDITYGCSTCVQLGLRKYVFPLNLISSEYAPQDFSHRHN